MKYTINKTYTTKDKKTFAWYVTFENDSNEYEFNLEYSNSTFYKGLSATLSKCKDNFASVISCKRLQFIKRFSDNKFNSLVNNYKPGSSNIITEMYQAAKERQSIN